MGFFRQLKNSFTNFENYNEIVFQKTGKTLKYFFLLFTLVFILGSLRAAYDLNAGAAEMINTAKARIPEFSLSNGELVVAGQQPVVLEGDNDTVLIIDTTGKTDETALEEYSEGVFISKYKLVSKQNFEKREMNFSNFKGFKLNKEKLVSWLPMIKWLFLFFGMVMYFINVVWVLITTVMLAILSNLMLKSPVKNKLRFSNLWSIAVYCMTLPWILEALKNLLYPGLPLFFILKWGTALLIMYKATEAINNKIIAAEETEPPSDPAF